MLRQGLAVLAVGAAVLGLSVSGASALDRRVKIVNNTSYTIEKFQASNKKSNSWEEDILGNKVLKPGQSIIINIDDGTGFCKFDFRATFDDGDTAEKRDVNVCKVSTFTFND